MMNAMLFCEECGAANSGQLPYCFACHKPLTLPASSPSTSDVSATFTQMPVGNGKIAYFTLSSNWVLHCRTYVPFQSKTPTDWFVYAWDNAYFDSHHADDRTIWATLIWLKKTVQEDDCGT